MSSKQPGFIRSTVGWAIINAAQALWSFGAWCIGGKAVFFNEEAEDTSDRAPQPIPAAAVSEVGKAMVYDRSKEPAETKPPPEPPLKGSARARMREALDAARKRDT